MIKLLIFGGTTEGRELAEYLTSDDKYSARFDITLSVATSYGAEFIDRHKVKMLVGRLTSEDILTLLYNEKFDYVIDSTHPYAIEVSKNIRKSMQNFSASKYIRLLRRKSDLSNCILVDSIEEACDKTADGNVLASTGSKQIAEYKTLNDFESRLYARVLPTEESVNLCRDAGLDDSHILTNTGAVSLEDNLMMIDKYDIKNIISKDGGAKGGFNEKKEAALLRNIRFIVIDRPSEDGMTYDEVVSFLCDLER